jgi:hypothetical protein
MVERGEILFRSLLHFQSCEDARRDELEGTHQYESEGGLVINNQNRGFTRTIPASSLRSSFKAPEQAFVFCTSQSFSAELAAKFGADACVEILDVETFLARLRTALRRNPRVKLATLRNSPVTYYDTALPPEAEWALPDEIIMHKRRAFVAEDEYRFAFSLKADAFAFENAAMTITTGPRLAVPPGVYPEMLLRLGRMDDCCRERRLTHVGR